MSIFHLEKTAAQASNSASLYGVYWSARDQDVFPLGNHHFITFIFEDQAQAERLTQKWIRLSMGWYRAFYHETNEKRKPIYFCSMGFGMDEEGYLKHNFNHSSDEKALKEIINPKEWISWRKSDYDYEGHRMPPSQASPPYVGLKLIHPKAEEKLMEAIIQRFANFDANYKSGKSGSRYKYNLINSNCATVINTIFKLVGYPQDQRERLGEFSGIDWGEEKAVPDSLFAPQSQPWQISDKSPELKQPFHGLFQTNYGKIALVQNGNLVLGDYRDIGMIKGQYNPSQQVLEGLFINDKARGNFRFRSTDKGFEGMYAWGKNPPNEVWSGTFISREDRELANAYFQGTYETDHGILRLHQQGNIVFGDYKNVGIIEGIFNPKTLEIIGRFTNGSEEGSIKFKLTDEGFMGSWGWNKDEPKSPWKGTKVSWKKPQLVTYSTYV